MSVESSAQAEALLALEESYDFWTEIGVGRTVDIKAAPEQVDSLTSVLDEANISHSVMIADVGAVVEMSKMVPVSPEVREAQGHSMDWNDYHPIKTSEIYKEIFVARPKSVSFNVEGLAVQYKLALALE